MKNTIGEIVKVKKYNGWYFDILFYDFPEELSLGFFNPVSWTKEFIDFYSPNKEDLEAILNANKYNI